MKLDLRKAMKAIKSATKHTGELIESSEDYGLSFNESSPEEFEIESRQLAEHCQRIVDIGIDSLPVVENTILEQEIQE